MPNFYEISTECSPQKTISKYINNYSQHTNRNVIVYYSGWLTQKHFIKGVDINDSDKSCLMNMTNNLDKSKGLDLFLHTPGGDVGATESIIDYLNASFNGDINAIIPQIAMSGGTMIACSCREIVMGTQSNLGPIDPQFGNIPAEAIISEFEQAKKEVCENPKTIPIWQTILSKYPPAFVNQCQHAREWSENILKKSLTYGMFDESETDAINKIKKELGSHEITKNHGKHISQKECIDMGLKIRCMEDDEVLQDMILSIHYACMNFFNENKKGVKLIANNNNLYFMQ